MLDRMRQRSDLRASAVAVAAGAGTLGGHWAAYRVAVPEAHLRDHVLAQAGHGYWGVAAKGGVALAVGVAVAVVLGGMRAGARGQTTTPKVGSLIRKLATLQVLGFVGLEVVERLASGTSLAGLLSHRLLAVGVVVQVLVAAASALAMRWLHRAAVVIGATLVQRPTLGVMSPRVRPTRTSPPLRLTLAGAAGLRSPPIS
jgi:hypothetical protein